MRRFLIAVLAAVFLLGPPVPSEQASGNVRAWFLDGHWPGGMWDEFAIKAE